MSAEKSLPVTFSSFVVSLGGTAMEHMGLSPHPEAQPKNLALARQTIDLIGLLQEKTKGNLDEEEQTLIDSLLYELRLKWTEASKSE